ncbi:lipopolysaccharide biosynthesis protein RfbH [Endomicrobium proavitum]|uniref:Putative CDP-4-keto-6-deoxy-D-glucose-3-dehydratase n=1 Tax=Endomicrobium proavitum TaxID=1408281 RepID=A0A0G3WJZ9_9BACT|nr:lipopolysaccharide biosynthesis protein RfbH [Endomicrobium proavitum]AKL98633.1 putative CDP-4-keto-6-deoxy-D-glucose-3-dehydratase [Endomicrobium proavitum]
MKKTLAKILRSSIIGLSGVYYNLAKPDVKTGKYVAVSGKVLGAAELKNLVDASLDMWLTAGRFNDKFESAFAAFLGSKYALTTNSGSSANLLAIAALTSHKLGDRRLKKGDEVITVAAGFPTTVTPIIQNGLVPVFVDVEIGNYNISVNQIEEAVTAKTKAVFVAHTLGNVFDLDAVKEICDKRGLWLIEDSCDALGSKFNGKFTGTVGHIGTFSFYPAHHITMGEGGALCTNDAQLYKIIMSVRDWGRDCWCPPGKDDTCKKRFSMKFGNMPLGYDHKYVYSHLGYNLKITDWQAACGVAQLKKLQGFIHKRNDNFNYLYKQLARFEKYLVLPQLSKKAEPSWFGFTITIKPNDKFTKIDLVKFLEENNVGTRQLFAGNLLRQPVFTDNDIEMRIRNSQILNSKNLTEEHYKLLPNTDTVLNATFWIGVWPGLRQDQLEYIISKFEEFFKHL